MTKKLYINDKIEVSWEPGLCIHSGICARGMRAVFDPKRVPWIILENGANEEIVAQVGKCPSGALKVRRVGESA